MKSDAQQSQEKQYIAILSVTNLYGIFYREKIINTIL